MMKKTQLDTNPNLTLARTQRSMISKSIMPTAPLCIDNNQRCTTLLAADSATSDQLLSINDGAVGMMDLDIMLLCSNPNPIHW